MNFGTGAVKITPAHDGNDYEVGERHNLPFINIFTDEGRIVGDCGKFRLNVAKRYYWLYRNWNCIVDVIIILWLCRSAAALKMWWNQGSPFSEISDYWVVVHSKAEVLQKASEKFQAEVYKIVLQQDEDVLDTWFSLFPFSVFGWPDQTDDLKTFFPTTFLETGHDILVSCVARKVFFSQKFLRQLPFKQVYLHPMVRGAHGRKMSKWAMLWTQWMLSMV
uniref:valine--tRNA ligase n=1 Tax=Glossina palpalis gambiensis TaxID=67801 RepID=A0A1B0BH58_9MUSC